MTPYRKGFTLIELLIVVAIIAILAAIAVPNFLEAQTRAKVSRVKADMKSYATALESYSVDNNDYPPTFALNNFVDFEVFTLEDQLIRLSTPTAYMTTGLLPEPFNARQGWVMYKGWNVVDDGYPPDAATRVPIYGYIAFPNDSMIEPMAFFVQAILAGLSLPYSYEETVEMVDQRWLLISPGPDTFFRFDQSLRINGPSITTALVLQAAAVVFPDQNGIYDPTNGTISIGEICRTSDNTFLDGK